MRVLTGFSQKAGGRTYTLLCMEIDHRQVGRMAAHVAKAGDGLSKKSAEVAAKLLLEQFPSAQAVEVRAGTLTTKVLR